MNHDVGQCSYRVLFTNYIEPHIKFLADSDSISWWVHSADLIYPVGHLASEKISSLDLTPDNDEHAGRIGFSV